MSPISQPALPSFEVHLTAPDIGRWLPGNTGVRGFITRDSGVAGPHVALLAIAHGNEIAGAIVLDRLLETRLAPTRGRLTFGFVNLGRIRAVRSAPADRVALHRRGHQPGVGRGGAGQRAALHRARPRARDPAADRHGGCAVRPALDAVAVGSADPVRHVAEGEAACTRRRRAGVGGGRPWACERAPHHRLFPVRRCGDAVRGEPGGGGPALAAGDGGHDVRQRRGAAASSRCGGGMRRCRSGTHRSSVSPRSPWR